MKIRYLGILVAIVVVLLAATAVYGISYVLNQDVVISGTAVPAPPPPVEAKLYTSANLTEEFSGHVNLSEVFVGAPNPVTVFLRASEIDPVTVNVTTSMPAAEGALTFTLFPQEGAAYPLELMFIRLVEGPFDVTVNVAGNKEGQ